MKTKTEYFVLWDSYPNSEDGSLHYTPWTILRFEDSHLREIFYLMPRPDQKRSLRYYSRTSWNPLYVPEEFRDNKIASVQDAQNSNKSALPCWPISENLVRMIEVLYTL